ncbi:MAG TPA: hypothetical protein VF019_08925, partial [Nitrospira sp.]
MTRNVSITLLGALLMAGGIWVSATHVAVHSELSDLLPEGATTTQRLLLTEMRRGLAGRLALLALEGGDPDEMAQASRLFSDRLRASGQLALVENGAQGLTPQERALVFQARYLLSPNVGRQTFSRESLREALERRLDELRSPLAPLVKETIPADPTGEFFTIVSAWSAEDGPVKHHGVWMSKDQTKALLVAQTRAAGFD